MTKQDYHFNYEVYDSINDLSDEDSQLLTAARKVTEDAYAPYSRFQVGAMARLQNGKLVSGTNQENASYPVGICAERVLLSAAASFFPNIPIQTIAISYYNNNGDSNRPISPCGICRQSLVEYEMRMKQPIRLILGGMEGQVIVIKKALNLLPISFSSDDMNG